VAHAGLHCELPRQKQSSNLCGAIKTCRGWEVVFSHYGPGTIFSLATDPDEYFRPCACRRFGQCAGDIDIGVYLSTVEACCIRDPPPG
jgi:hypothetical protein